MALPNEGDLHTIVTQLQFICSSWNEHLSLQDENKDSEARPLKSRRTCTPQDETQQRVDEILRPLYKKDQTGLVKEEVVNILFHVVNTRSQMHHCHVFAIFKFLVYEYSLSKEDIVKDNNLALRWSAAAGNLEVVKYLKEYFGLTNGDVRAWNNDALRLSAKNGHLAGYARLSRRQ